MRYLIKRIKGQIFDLENSLQKLATEKDSKDQAEERDYILSYIDELHNIADEIEKHAKRSVDYSEKS